MTLAYGAVQLIGMSLFGVEGVAAHAATHSALYSAWRDDLACTGAAHDVRRGGR